MEETNSRFHIDPDIALAKTLNTGFLYRSDLFEESRKKIFSKSWQFIGDESLVAQQGSCFPFTLLEDFLDEPLLLTKDRGSDSLFIQCMHASGNVLWSVKPASLSHIRCRYHGRQFRLDGSFLSMPEFKEVKNFPTPADNLTQLTLASMGSLVFYFPGLKS